MGLIPGGAIVTGASRGIGAGIAAALGRAGAGVVVNYNVAAEQAAAVVAGIRREGGRAIAVQADVTKEEDIAALVETARRELGEIGILVSNAAIPPHLKPFPELAWDDFQRELEGAPRAFFHLAQALLPEMVARGQGRLIAIGSTTADTPIPGSHAYATAKSALGGMLKTLAKEVGEHGVTVNLVVPSLTGTERADVVSDEFKRAEARRNPMRRIGSPEDTAGAVVYLASDEAQYVTGTSILVDGGHGLS